MAYNLKKGDLVRDKYFPHDSIGIVLKGKKNIVVRWIIHRLFDKILTGTDHYERDLLRYEPSKEE